MKKISEFILKVMMVVFMVVILLPVTGRTISADNVDVVTVSISPTSTTINVYETVQLVATVSPNSATDKTVLWSVTSTTNSVKLYEDEQCTTEIGAEATDKRAVFAKGEAAGEATVTVKSNSNPELSASCNIIVASAGDFITVQPQDALVSYPDGATFSVEVANPDLVASYQWHVIDQDQNDFVMDGETGDDPTLFIPSTVQRDQELFAYCVIKDTEGNTYSTRKASLDQENRYTEKKPVFYVGEYALEPGESLNLATTYHDPEHQYPLGRGVVTFDANGHDIILDNVLYDNAYTTAALVGVSANVALDLEWQTPDPDVVQEVNLILKGGENKIVDRLYQPQVNLSGFPVFFCFWGRDLQAAYSPKVNIVEDANDPGFLTVVNGTAAIYAYAELTIDADINIDQNRLEYGDGIEAFSIDIKEGHNLNLHTNGSLFIAAGDNHNHSIKPDITIRGTRIDAYAREPHVGTGATSKYGISSHNNLTIEDSIIDYQLEIDYVAGRIEELAGCEFINCSNKTQVKNSKIILELSDHPDDKDHALFAHHLIGWYGDDISIDNSEIRMDLISALAFQVGGLKGNNISITNGSKINIDVETYSGALAVYAEGNLTITDSDVNATVKNLTDSIITPFAISAANLNIDLSENNYVKATAANVNNGEAVAVAGMHGPYLFSTEVGGTGPGAITLADDTSIIDPVNGTIGAKTVDINPSKKNINIVTVLDEAGEVAEEVEITNKQTTVYTQTKGKNASWGMDIDAYLELVYKRYAFDKDIKDEYFKEVRVDGVAISSEFYTLDIGSLIVRIKPAYLKRLTVGKHTVSVVFKDGQVDTLINIVPQYSVPDTSTK